MYIVQIYTNHKSEVWDFVQAKSVGFLNFNVIFLNNFAIKCN